MRWIRGGGGGRPDSYQNDTIRYYRDGIRDIFPLSDYTVILIRSKLVK